MVIAIIIIAIIAIAIFISSGKKAENTEEKKDPIQVYLNYKKKEIEKLQEELDQKKSELESLENEEFTKSSSDDGLISFETAIYEETPDPEGEPKHKFSCRIAGLKYHQENILTGGFIGYADQEPWNPEDNEAVGIYDLDGKIQGYVSKKAKENYLAYFPDKAPCLAVGWIKEEEPGEYSSNVIFIRIHTWEYAARELANLLKMYMGKGWEYYKEDIKRTGDYLLKRMEESIEVLEQIDGLVKQDNQVDKQVKETQEIEHE